MRKFVIAAFACLLTLGLTAHDAEAKRLGGGTSRGMQRDSVTQRQAAPQPTAPSQQMAPQASGTATPATPAPRRSWLGPLAGLAAGLGLGALLAHFGLGEGMADFLMVLLLVMAAVFVFKLIFRRPQPRPAGDSIQYAGVGGPHMAPAPAPASSHFESADSPTAASAALARNIPPDFDAEGFLRVAKVNFIRLQAANDAGNFEDIREFTTPEMFAEIKLDIDERRGASQQTDVVTLEAELLEVIAETNRHIASVRFHGMIREEHDGTAQRFDEVWHLLKPIDGSRGWVVAGIQQLN